MKKKFSIILGVVIAIATFAYGAGLLSKTDSTERDSNGNIVGSGNLSAFSVKVGDCLGGQVTDGESVEDFQGVPCTQSHLYEVFFNGESALEKYDDAKITDEAEIMCASAFKEYVGIPVDDSQLTYNYLLPSPESWLTGDRSISCLANTLDMTPLTASVKNSGK
ncbi:MAG: hypothetical protein RIS43_1052 [Actinomycetota bacterium]|jgi:hypothetical protein